MGSLTLALDFRAVPYRLMRVGRVRPRLPPDTHWPLDFVLTFGMIDETGKLWQVPERALVLTTTSVGAIKLRDALLDHMRADWGFGHAPALVEARSAAPLRFRLRAERGAVEALAAALGTGTHRLPAERCASVGDHYLLGAVAEQVRHEQAKDRRNAWNL